MTAGLKENRKLKEMDNRRKEKEDNEAASPEVAFTIRHTTGIQWEFVKLFVKDGKVVKEEVKECDDKSHATETFQVEFVNTFIYGK